LVEFDFWRPEGGFHSPCIWVRYMRSFGDPVFLHDEFWTDSLSCGWQREHSWNQILEAIFSELSLDSTHFIWCWVYSGSK
jgi:hypothetical protein